MQVQKTNCSVCQCNQDGLGPLIIQQQSDIALNKISSLVVFMSRLAFDGFVAQVIVSFHH